LVQGYHLIKSLINKIYLLIMFYKIKMAFSLQKKKTPQIWNENCTKPHLLNIYKK